MNLEDATVQQLEDELARRKKEACKPPEPLASPDWSRLLATIAAITGRLAAEFCGEMDREEDNRDLSCIYEAAIESVYGPHAYWAWYRKHV